MRQSRYNFVSTYSQITTSSLAKSWCWDHFSTVIQNIRIVYSCTLLPMFLQFSYLIHFIFCILDTTFLAHRKGIAAFFDYLACASWIHGTVSPLRQGLFTSFCFFTIKNFSLRILVYWSTTWMGKFCPFGRKTPSILYSRSLSHCAPI